MKKSTWKKLFTRSKSKSATRASKKSKVSTAACNMCAGISVVNVDTLCTTHKDKIKSPPIQQGAVSVGRIDSSPKAVADAVKNTNPESVAAAAPMVSPEPAAPMVSSAAPAAQTVSPIESSTPSQPEMANAEEPPSPQPPEKSSNEEFMTEEVDSRHLSENSRAEENTPTVEEPANEASISIELKALSAIQGPTRSSASEQENTSDSRDLRMRRSGTQIRDSKSQTSGNQEVAEPAQQKSSSGIQDDHHVKLRVRIQSSSESTKEVNAKEDVSGEIPHPDIKEDDEKNNVEAKNLKNLNNIGPSRRESQNSERLSSPSKNEFLSEAVTTSRVGSAEREEAYPKSSRQVSSAINIPGHDSQAASSHHIQIVEVNDQDRPAYAGLGLSIDAPHSTNYDDKKSPILNQTPSKESSEDLKPGVLQAQRSSKLNISFSEHLSLLGDKKGSDPSSIQQVSTESSENSTEVTVIETTTIVTSEVDEGVLRLGIPTGAQSLTMSSEAESVEALPPLQYDEPLIGVDSGMGSEESNSSGPRESPEETSIQENPSNARASPTIIFGSYSAPETDHDWSQPLFFGPNALSHSLTLNIDNRDREVARNADVHGPFQGLGIISITRDLFTNDSSASQVQEAKVTEVSEEERQVDKGEQSAQEPPVLEDEDAEPEEAEKAPKKTFL